MKKKNKILFCIAALLLCLTVYLYLTIPGAYIHVKPNDSRNHIHKIYGKPCGTYFYKCCGIEIGDKFALSSDIWKRSHFLGEYRTMVYFDKYDRVIESKMGFQWFYEPILYGFEQDADSCEQYMKTTKISQQFERIKNYIHRKIR